MNNSSDQEIAGSSSTTQLSQEEEGKEKKPEEPLPSNRFELELEFIQCLASPAYLHYLGCVQFKFVGIRFFFNLIAYSTSGLLTDPAFIKFLEYLTYWKRREYIRFISYPNCFYFLDLLINNERFRREIATVPFRNFVHEQQFYSWQFRSRNLYGDGLPRNDDKINANNDETS